MKTLSEVRADGSDYEISLAKLTSKKVADIHGYISMEFGEPTIKITKAIMEDGSNFHFEGEHDFPYLTCGYGEKANEIDDDELQAIYDEENPDDED